MLYTDYCTVLLFLFVFSGRSARNEQCQSGANLGCLFTCYKQVQLKSANYNVLQNSPKKISALIGLLNN